MSRFYPVQLSSTHLLFLQAFPIRNLFSQIRDSSSQATTCDCVGCQERCSTFHDSVRLWIMRLFLRILCLKMTVTDPDTSLTARKSKRRDLSMEGKKVEAKGSECFTSLRCCRKWRF
ncbi:hypothetical protein RvY_13013 [Ramazzottius varieornatus]|uniref:Uncharacterized protein n=1 Tax=Ramazzottius varieornatus TaxID=947166 RepID=A0A1D1VRT3_RAMVA|nr:hypothetical protein RvY_13013 [Ramazzottius varieornatus]